MTTITCFKPMRLNTVAELVKPADDHSVPFHVLGRLIQITLALYLLPVLLVVLMVSGIGIAVLKLNQVLGHLVEG